MNPKVSFNVVTWNGARYLPDLLSSLEHQTDKGDLKEISVRIVDNASDDETMDLLHRFPKATIIRNARNLGFAAAHNQAIRFALDKWVNEDLLHCYVVVANQDLVLTPACVQELVSAMETNAEAGSAQGKLLRAFIEHPEDEYLTETVCADRIDSTGLRPLCSHRCVDRGAGELDGGEYDEPGEIFGPTGALAVYRASALESVRFGDEFFDGDFFMYKEDVDLAWRLRRAGWKSLYVPSAVAYHHRGLAGSERPRIIERIRNRRRKRPILSMLSTRNHHLTLLKNLGWFEAVLFSPWIVFVESRQILYSLIFEPFVIRGLIASVRLWPRMLRKRRAIMKSRKISSRELWKWFR